MKLSFMTVFLVFTSLQASAARYYCQNGESIPKTAVFEETMDYKYSYFLEVPTRRGTNKFRGKCKEANEEEIEFDCKVKHKKLGLTLTFDREEVSAELTTTYPDGAIMVEAMPCKYAFH